MERIIVQHCNSSSCNDDSLVQFLSKNKIENMVSSLSDNSILLCLYSCAIFDKFKSFLYLFSLVESKWMYNHLKSFKIKPFIPKPNEITIDTTTLMERSYYKLITHCLLDSIIFPQKHVRESAVFMNNLHDQINIYKQFINKYPCLQFETTIFRLLPHLYAKSLFEQLNMIPTVELVNGDTNTFNTNTNNNSNTNSNSKKIKQQEVIADIQFDYTKIRINDEFTGNIYQLSPEIAKILSKIFDTYAMLKTTYKDSEDIISAMSSSDLITFFRACGRREYTSWSIGNIIVSHMQDSKEINNMPCLSKEGFFCYYIDIATKQAREIIANIVYQGFGQDLCYRMEDIDVENSDAANDPAWKVKYSFVNYLNKKFVNSEWILINYMIKKSNMKNVFDKLNDDVVNLIFKMIHPLNISESRKTVFVNHDKNDDHDDDEHKIVNVVNNEFGWIEEEIRNKTMYCFDFDFINAEYIVSCNPFFYSLAQRRLKMFGPSFFDGDTIDAMLDSLQDTKLNVVDFVHNWVQQSFNDEYVNKWKKSLQKSQTTTQHVTYL